MRAFRGIVLSSAVLSLISIGCDKGKFSSQAPTGEAPNEETPATADAEPVVVKSTPIDSTNTNPQTQAGGVPGGHFDLDTSIQTYAFNQGTTVQHVHEYDDKFSVTGVNFFKMLDDKFVEPAEAVAATQTFKIIVANAQLSPGARININGQSYLATDWQKRSASGDLPIFSLGGAAGTQKLTALTVTFDPAKAISNQLIPTDTALVRSNAPGPGQSYRAGALIIQMIDAATGQIDSALGVAKIGAPGMLWESTLFWHVDPAKKEE